MIHTRKLIWIRLRIYKNMNFRYVHETICIHIQIRLRICTTGSYIANLTHTNLNSFTSMSNRSLTVAVNINGFKYVCVCLVRTGFPLNLEERKRIRIRMRVWDLRNRHSVSLGLLDLHIRIRLCTDYFLFSRYVYVLRKRIWIRLRIRIV